MSIWSSIGGSDILGLENDGDAANYRGEGVPSVTVDVATTGQHDLIRLGVWREEEPRIDVDVLLTPAAARLLRDRLTEALEER